ncbi:GNAT family N-acetyltransferase [Planococcus sp. N028]|uniref:GNAT family N-acetyltransferase n=1 Tax=Planococcus shixiaomingii TaxID=3058393 RepID=A0ABT8N574_9BACL|nr:MULTISPECIES: GNAT family N-acetyltransferase [unclassified Planococcus (in: firmicutes)]MDN7243032.1 GNAT family N-acetyltransferase [Planococcus sp. N028]WKA54974.1 GNAT family N-acetyltransferase [Planococcus sp. N022]
MDIKIDDLSGKEIASLLAEHLQDMAVHSPPESIHALDLETLRKPEITFWSVWEEGQLVGCGALKELDSYHGEIKSMRTSPKHRRKGVAKLLIEHIIKQAEYRGYKRLSLETGSMQAFEPARKLYSSYGFHFSKPFSDYSEDPNSVFMFKEL